MYGAYAATKAAQDAIASALRAELHEQGIAVTSVHPIGTNTEFHQRVRDQNHNPAVKPNTPDAVRQSPEHVAQCILRAIRRPQAEVWPSLPSRLGVGIAAAFPGLAAWGLRQHRAQDAPKPSAAVTPSPSSLSDRV